jgi:hypothetical protein
MNDLVKWNSAVMNNLYQDLKVPCKLIGIHGRAHSGKDTCAGYLHDRYADHWIEAFADPLKAACKELFGIPEEFFYDQTMKEQIIPGWEVSARMAAQFVGTELVRENMWKLLSKDYDNFWVRRMAYKLQGTIEGDGVSYTAEDTIIIPDVRFQNEHDWIIDNGGIIIHLTRPELSGTVGLPAHKSEAGIQFTAPNSTYHVINDDTLDILFLKLRSIFEPYLHNSGVLPE